MVRAPPAPKVPQVLRGPMGLRGRKVSRGRRVLPVVKARKGRLAPRDRKALRGPQAALALKALKVQREQPVGPVPRAGLVLRAGRGHRASRGRRARPVRKDSQGATGAQGPQGASGSGLSNTVVVSATGTSGGTSAMTVSCPAGHPNAVSGGFSTSTTGAVLYSTPIGGSSSSAATGWQASVNFSVVQATGQTTVYAVCSS